MAVFLGSVKSNSGKYYIEYETESGINKKEYFDKLPKNTYFAAGYQDIKDKGLAYIAKMTKRGTSLIPIRISKTKKQF